MNKSWHEAFSPCVSVMWYEVMHMVLGATLWPNLAPHPAEWTFQDSLFHFNWNQAGHQAGQCVIDDRREGRLVRRQRKNEPRCKTYTPLKSAPEFCSDTVRYLELSHELLQVDDELLHPGIISFIIIKLLLWGTWAVTATCFVTSDLFLFREHYLFYVVWDGQEAADPGFNLRLYGCCV